MISRPTKNQEASLNVLKLPTHCVPVEESSTLASKREAQLSWMREKGLSYLGDAPERLERRPSRLALTSMRLVSVGKEPHEDAVVVRDTAREA